MNANGSGPGRVDGLPDTHLRDFVNFVRRNVVLVGALTVAVVGATAWYTWTTPPVYQAATTIHVDQERAVTPELEFLSDVVRASDVETEMALLHGRSLAERTVDTLALQVRLVRPQATRRDELFTVVEASPIAVSERYTLTLDGGQYRIEDSERREVTAVRPGEATVFNGIRLIIDPDPEGGLRQEIELAVFDRYQAVDDLSGALAVGRPFRDASVISVSYQGTDPGLVAAVPNTLAQLFIAERRQAKKTEATSTVTFLNEQIDFYTTELAQAEDDLLSFQQGEQVVNLEAEGAQQVTRMVALQADLDDSEGELSTLTGILDEIDRVQNDVTYDGPSPFRRLAGFPTFLQNQVVTQLLTDLTRVQNEYIQMRQRREETHPEVQSLSSQVAEVEDQLYQLALSYQESLRNQVSSVRQRLSAFGTQLERIPEKDVQEQRLERRKATVESIFNLLQTQLKEAEIAQAVEPGDVRVVDAAILPRDPIRPRKFRSLVLSLLFGLTLGMSVAGARDYLDETIHTREELGRVTGLPVLALIPRIRGMNGNGKSAFSKERPVRERLVTRDDIANPVSEAYRAFRTNITFLNLEGDAKVLVFTSPGPAEGKSTSAANLAITMAQQGTEAILLDCDLRRGIGHRVFDARKEPGLTNVLLGQAKLDEAIHKLALPDGRSLDFLATGTLPPNPSELLGSRRMREVMDELRARYELVLIDSPPLNVVTDAAVLGTLADGVILIARAGATARESLRYARDQLEAVQAKVSGAVLNDVDFSGRDRYYGSGAGYRYYYRYYKTDDA